MSASGSDINFLLKKVYSNEGVKDLENMDDTTYQKLGTSSKKIGGKGFEFPLKTKGNQANLGATNENEANPTGGNQTGTQGTILPKIVKQAVRFSGLALEKSKGDADSYADVLTYELDAGIRDHYKELNQELYRDGSGVIAKVNGAVSADTDIIVDNGVITHFRVGMRLAAYNGATLEATNMEVTSVDIANSTVTVNSAVTLTDNDNLYRYIDGVGDTFTNAPTDGKEISGLKLLTDDGSISATYEDVNRTNFPAFKGIGIDFNSANLSDDALHQAISRCLVESGFKHSSGKSMICSNTAQFRKYMSILTPAREYRPSDKMDSSGDKMPTWLGIDWQVDTDCGFDEIYIINKEDAKKYILRDVHYDDTDGKILKYVGGMDAFYAYSKSYLNVGGERPNTHVRMYDLATPTY